MEKPSFGVVTGVVLVLSALAFAARSIVGLIPPGPENRLASESADFLKRAAHEPIDWRVLNDALFVEARKRDRPIMLMVGSACNAKGRSADALILSTRDVRGFLTRKFLCARVDSMAHPELASCFLPVSRALATREGRIAVSPDFQIWFLDPTGKLFGFSTSTALGRPFDDRTLLADLKDAEDRFESIQNGKTQAGAEQKRDVASLEAAYPDQLPDVQGYAGWLAGQASDQGGFPVNGVQRLWPGAWKFQLLARRTNDYSRSIAPCLLSPMVDLIDGGFFSGSASWEWRQIGYDKSAAVNAAMAETLAIGSVVMQDPQQRWFSLSTLDCLLGSFVNDGQLWSGQMGDDDPYGRSTRVSFSPRALRDLFPDSANREWVREHLGLRVETNPQMTPMLGRLDLPQTEPQRLAAALALFRRGLKRAEFAGLNYLDSSGYAAARMMVAARILGETDRMQRARQLFDHLDNLRASDDVVHSDAADSRGRAYFGDYLGYADGALQAFLSTGDAKYLTRGASVLRRGLFLYRGRLKGEYTLMKEGATGSLQDVAAPEIVDPGIASCSARAMRLCNDYGRLLGDGGRDLVGTATEIQSRFAPVAPLLGQFGAGYFCAAVDVLDDAWAVVIGPNSTSDANHLATSVPDRLIAPGLGPVARGLSKPGIYIIKATSTVGPLSEAQAVKALARRAF